jgi:pimeloyl-ACP methyl ester carboxylesterase
LEHRDLTSEPDQDAVREGWFENDGLRLHYRTWGRPERPAVVCLHGGAHTLAVWRDLAARLAADWFVVALDQRGHGESDWSPEKRYGRDDFVGDLVALVDRFGFDRVAFVGHSMGGNNGLRFTVRHPERVRRLVIADVGPTVGARYGDRPATDIAVPPVKDSLDAFIDEAARRNPRRPRAFYERILTPNLRQLPDGWWTWKHDPGFLKINEDYVDPTLLAERWGSLPGVQQPVLLIRGERSTILSAEVAERMMAALPNARFHCLPNIGHNVHLDVPDALAALVLPFLAEDPVQ